MAMNQKRRAGEKKALQKAKENYAEEKCIVDFEWNGEFVKDGHLCESVQVNSTLRGALGYQIRSFFEHCSKRR